MRYRIRHSTELAYAAPVHHGQFNLRLLPAPWKGQQVSRCLLHISPRPVQRSDTPGPYCVTTTSIGYLAPLGRLELLTEMTVEISAGPETENGPQITEVRSQALAQRDISVVSTAPYLFASRIAGVDGEIADWAMQILPQDQPIVPAVSKVMEAVHREFTYKPGATTSATPPLDAFRLREGVCQDFAHVMISALRSQGIPAAYASGYLRTVPPPGKPRLVGADAMHAWANVWCGEQLGWIGFDPTNNCLVREDHIQIGMGRDYADVSPIDGTFVGTAPQTMKTAVDVEPIE